MYLRFTTATIDEVSKKPAGVFTSAYALLDSGELTSAEWLHLREILDWYKANLPTPPEKFYASRAIFWFRSGSEESIRRIWDLVAILRAHDRPVTIYKCRHLGNITYFDRFQVAAFPSEHDGKVTVQ